GLHVSEFFLRQRPDHDGDHSLSCAIPLGVGLKNHLCFSTELTGLRDRLQVNGWRFLCLPIPQTAPQEDGNRQDGKDCRSGTDQASKCHGGCLRKTRTGGVVGSAGCVSTPTYF